MQPLIQNNIHHLQALCLEHGIQRMHVFGSAVRDDFNEESDVDFLVEYKSTTEPMQVLHQKERLSEALQSLLKRKVDLIEYQLLENKYLKHFINQEKVLLYAEA